MRYRNVKTGVVLNFVSLIESPDWVAVEKPAAQSNAPKQEAKRRGRTKKE